MCILGSAPSIRETASAVNVEIGSSSCEVCFLLCTDACSWSEGQKVAVSIWRAPTKSIFVQYSALISRVMALLVVPLQYKLADTEIHIKSKISVWIYFWFIPKSITVMVVRDDSLLVYWIYKVSVREMVSESLCALRCKGAWYCSRSWKSSWKVAEWTIASGCFCFLKEQEPWKLEIAVRCLFLAAKTSWTSASHVSCPGTPWGDERSVVRTQDGRGSCFCLAQISVHSVSFALIFDGVVPLFFFFF